MMRSTRNKGFSLELCSDLDFEGMVVDVNYDDHPIATGNYDKGVNNIEITLLPIYTDSIPTASQKLGISQNQRLRFDSIEAASYPRDRSDADRVEDRDADEEKNQVLARDRYKTLSVPLDEFLKALEKAKKILQRCAKEDETRDKL
ncbi:MAG: hypothetical protein KDK76_06785 [Chlamydiia bacterium]|nr:hypothetical protein [Chlamydiia bacterium]